MHCKCMTKYVNIRHKCTMSHSCMQVSRAIGEMLSDQAGQADQMVVVLDWRNATTLHVTRKTTLIKHTAKLLNEVRLPGWNT